MSQRGDKRASWQRKMIGHYQNTTCEWLGCFQEGANAHRLKKRFITCEEEYIHGRAMLCWGHHRPLDEATGPNVHERMFETIDNIMRMHGRVVVTPDSQQMAERIERLKVCGCGMDISLDQRRCSACKTVFSV